MLKHATGRFLRDAAISLYKSLGFRETGNRDEEELEMKLTGPFLDKQLQKEL